MENNLAEYIIQSILTFIIAFFTFLFTKKKYQNAEISKINIETESSVSDTIVKNLGIYQKMLDDLDERHQENILKRDQEIKLLESNIENLKNRVKYLEENCN